MSSGFQTRPSSWGFPRKIGLNDDDDELEFNDASTLLGH